MPSFFRTDIIRCPLRFVLTIDLSHEKIPPRRSIRTSNKHYPITHSSLRNRLDYSTFCRHPFKWRISWYNFLPQHRVRTTRLRLYTTVVASLSFSKNTLLNITSVIKHFFYFMWCYWRLNDVLINIRTEITELSHIYIKNSEIYSSNEMICWVVIC